MQTTFCYFEDTERTLAVSRVYYFKLSSTDLREGKLTTVKMFSASVFCQTRSLNEVIVPNLFMFNFFQISSHFLMTTVLQLGQPCLQEFSPIFYGQNPGDEFVIGGVFD